YPNAMDVVTDLGGRLVPVPMRTDDQQHSTWDDGGLEAAVRQTAPRAAYLIPDFQNPSGALMAVEQRERVARLLERAHTLAIVDETLVELGLDEPAPRPFAAFTEG